MVDKSGEMEKYFKQVCTIFDNLQSISADAIRNIFKHMPHGCIYCKIMTDTTGKPAGYTVAGFNDAVSLLLDSGSHSDSGLAEEIGAFINQTGLLPALSKVALDGTSLVWDQFFDVQQKWYSISVFSPENLYVALIIEDITARKLLEQELEESRKRYKALLKQSSDAIALVDSISKKIIEVNLRLCQMTGYSEEELCNMNIYHLLAGPNRKIDECQSELATKRYLPATARIVKCKDGTTIEVERVVSLINYNSHHLELVTFYDISEERKLQQIIQEEAAMASQVQRQMLPMDFKNEVVTIKGIHKPLHMVSGDFFDYRLSKDKTALTGFLVDVAGHGLATALQTAAINVLLQELIIHEKMPAEDDLHKLNQRMMGYFNEGSFAALLIFHFDFSKKSLLCAFCGINQILAFSAIRRGWIKAKGSIMGVFDNPHFDFIKVPIQPGDCFYFLTDGISEQLQDCVIDNLGDFSAAVKTFDDIANCQGTKDDCSAVCITLSGLPHECRYYFSGMEDAGSLQQEIRRRLTDIAGDRALYLEIALNEAINNVLIHGSGNGYFKIKSIGKRTILRVKDCKQGFNAKRVLKQYETRTTEEIAEIVSDMETGRGILIMKLFTDKIYYNRSGSEVMLVCETKSQESQGTSP